MQVQLDFVLYMLQLGNSDTCVSHMCHYVCMHVASPQCARRSSPEPFQMVGAKLCLKKRGRAPWMPQWRSLRNLVFCTLMNQTYKCMLSTWQDKAHGLMSLSQPSQACHNISVVIPWPFSVMVVPLLIQKRQVMKGKCWECSLYDLHVITASGVRHTVSCDPFTSLLRCNPGAQSNSFVTGRVAGAGFPHHCHSCCATEKGKPCSFSCIF